MFMPLLDNISKSGFFDWFPNINFILPSFDMVGLFLQCVINPLSWKNDKSKQTLKPSISSVSTLINDKSFVAKSPPSLSSRQSPIYAPKHQPSLHNSLANNIRQTSTCKDVLSAEPGKISNIVNNKF